MGRNKVNLYDSRGRKLKEGERQKHDGRYEYRHTDKSGKSKSVYSWRLIASDKTPPGKKGAPPLRQLIREIQRNLQDDINMDGGDFTVYELVSKYVKL